MKMKLMIGLILINFLLLFFFYIRSFNKVVLHFKNLETINDFISESFWLLKIYMAFKIFR